MDHIISIVIGSFNRLKFIKRTIASVREEIRNIPHEIIVVDGGSTDGTIDWLTRQKDIITLIQHNRGKWKGEKIKKRSWGYFMNLGFKVAQGKYLLMVSDDCLVVPGSIKNGVELFEKRLKNGEKLGGLAFYWRNTFIQNRFRVGLTLGDRMFINHGLFLHKAVESVGYCEEELYDFYHADGDLCLKMWKEGYIIDDCPNAFIEHFPHANKGVREKNLLNQAEDWEKYKNRWKGQYYFEEKPIIGSWKYLNYKDSFNTAGKFPFWPRLKIIFRQILKDLIFFKNKRNTSKH